MTSPNMRDESPLIGLSGSSDCTPPRDVKGNGDQGNHAFPINVSTSTSTCNTTQGATTSTISLDLSVLEGLEGVKPEEEGSDSAYA